MMYIRQLFVTDMVYLRQLLQGAWFILDNFL
jgi:hypothetical protein